MDWEKAKNLAIVFLLFLNIFLAFLLIKNTDVYYISFFEQREVIKSINNNNVYLEDDFIKRNPPMRNILVEEQKFNEQKLIEIFFPNNKFDYYKDETITSYKNEKSELILENNIITYQHSLSGVRDITIRQTEIFVDFIFNKYPNIFNDFIIDKTIIYDDSFAIMYKQKYAQYIIQSNYLNIFVYDESFKIEYSYSNIIGFDNEFNEICSMPEVLFILCKYLNMEYPEEIIYIKNVDVVYVIEGDKAYPYYRFETDISNNYFLINAYDYSILID